MAEDQGQYTEAAEQQTAHHVSSAAEVKPQPEGGQPSRLRTFGAVVAALFLYALLADAAVETFLSGSPVRWIVVGTIAAYLILTVLLWKRLRWETRAAFSLLVLLGLLAITGWLPGGLDRGVALAQQPTSTVFAAITAAAIGLSVLIWVRLRRIPVLVRAAFGLLTAYGIVAFVLGISDGTQYAELLHGRSFWERLPFWLQGVFLGVIVLLPTALLVHILNGLLRIRGSGLRWWTVQIFALGLSFVMAAAGFRGSHGYLSAQPSGRELVELRLKLHAFGDPKKLSAALASIEQMNTTAPSSGFDAAAMANELGPSIERNFNFVRDQIRYEVYEGVLRGSQGTLMAMAGNSYDKSLLLATLLNHHGLEVRFLRGRLDNERATRLISQMFAEAAKARIAGGQGPAAAPSSEIASFFRTLGQLLIVRGRIEAETVWGGLQRNRIQLGEKGPAVESPLRKEAMDHLWVEYRQGDKWKALDPSFGAAQPGDTFAPVEETWAALPPSVFHRVTIRLNVEERRNGTASTREVLRYEATAPDLNGARVSFTHLLSANSKGWSVTPILSVDGKGVTGKPYGTTENTAAGSLPGPSFDLSGVENQPEQAKPDITAVWFDFDFADPSDRTETSRREVFDRVGFVPRIEKRVATAPLMPLPELEGIPLPLVGFYAFSISSGRLHPGHLLAKISSQLEHLQAVLELLSVLQTSGRKTTNEEEQRLSSALREFLPLMLNLTAMSFHSLSQASRVLAARLARADALMYEATPRLAIASLGLTASNGGNIALVHVLDLRRNELRVVAEHGAKHVWANVVRGIIDAVIEHALLADLVPRAADEPGNASTVAIMERARDGGTPIAVITAREGIQVVKAPKILSARMRAKLDEHTIVVTPLRAVPLSGADRLGWWQIDVRSGETLGVMDTGLHQAMTEYEVRYHNDLHMKYMMRYFGPKAVTTTLTTATLTSFEIAAIILGGACAILSFVGWCW